MYARVNFSTIIVERLEQYFSLTWYMHICYLEHTSVKVNCLWHSQGQGGWMRSVGTKTKFLKIFCCVKRADIRRPKQNFIINILYLVYKNIFPFSILLCILKYIAKTNKIKRYFLDCHVYLNNCLTINGTLVSTHNDTNTTTPSNFSNQIFKNTSFKI